MPKRRRIEPSVTEIDGVFFVETSDVELVEPLPVVQINPVVKRKRLAKVPIQLIASDPNQRIPFNIARLAARFASLESADGAEALIEDCRNYILRLIFLGHVREAKEFARSLVVQANTKSEALKALANYLGGEACLKFHPYIATKFYARSLQLWPKNTLDLHHLNSHLRLAFCCFALNNFAESLQIIAIIRKNFVLDDQAHTEVKLLEADVLCAMHRFADAEAALGEPGSNYELETQRAIVTASAYLADKGNNALKQRAWGLFCNARTVSINHSGNSFRQLNFAMFLVQIGEYAEASSAFRRAAMSADIGKFSYWTANNPLLPQPIRDAMQPHSMFFLSDASLTHFCNMLTKLQQGDSAAQANQLTRQQANYLINNVSKVRDNKFDAYTILDLVCNRFASHRPKQFSNLLAQFMAVNSFTPQQNSLEQSSSQLSGDDSDTLTDEPSRQPSGPLSTTSILQTYAQI